MFQLLARRVAAEDAESPCLGIGLDERSDVPHADDAQRPLRGLPALRAGEVDERRADPLQYAPGVAARGRRDFDAVRHAVSMWSKPMVAVAISFTRESASSFSSHRVRVRITSASALRTSAAEIAVPGRYSTSANGSRTPRRKGMALSAMIFMVTGAFFVFRF